MSFPTPARAAIAAFLAGAAAGALAVWCAAPPALATVSLTYQIPDTFKAKLSFDDLQTVQALFAGAGDSRAAVTAGAERLTPGERLFVSVVRHHAARELQRDGFKCVGGDPRPLSKAEGETRLGKLDDAQILARARESGRLGDGKFLEKLGKVFEWFYAHKDQIIELVKIVLSLLALFGDGVIPAP